MQFLIRIPGWNKHPLALLIYFVKRNEQPEMRFMEQTLVRTESNCTIKHRFHTAKGGSTQAESNPGEAAKCLLFSNVSVGFFLFFVFFSGGFFLNDVTFILQCSDWRFVAEAFNLTEKMLFIWTTQSCFSIIIQHHCSNQRSSACEGLSCFTFYHSPCRVTVLIRTLKVWG